MKTIITYYSRTGRTAKIANKIGIKISADLQEIRDYKNRSGIFGFIASGNEAHLKKLIKIKEIDKNPENYDVAIIGTPIWANKVSTPVRSFLSEYKGKLRNFAFYCTSLGSDPKPVFAEMEKILNKKPITVMNITARDIKSQYHIEMIDKFIQEIKNYGKKLKINDR